MNAPNLNHQPAPAKNRSGGSISNMKTKLFHAACCLLILMELVLLIWGRVTLEELAGFFLLGFFATCGAVAVAGGMANPRN